jgi:hypothetical protein
VLNTFVAILEYLEHSGENALNFAFLVPLVIRLDIRHDISLIGAESEIEMRMELQRTAPIAGVCSVITISRRACRLRRKPLECSSGSKGLIFDGR